MRLLIATSLLVALGGCVAESFCAKRQECNDSLEDDSQAVCIAEFNSGINALRANQEDECQQLADATLALRACQAQLDCDDFEEADLGGKCDAEADDLDDAIRDVDGEDCSTFD